MPGGAATGGGNTAAQAANVAQAATEAAEDQEKANQQGGVPKFFCCRELAAQVEKIARASRQCLFDSQRDTVIE